MSNYQIKIKILYNAVVTISIHGINYNSICEYIDERFKHAEISADLFPHIVIKDILPEVGSVCNATSFFKNKLYQLSKN